MSDGVERGLRVVEAVFAKRAAKDRPRRPRSVRPSEIGAGCQRKTWLRFRWVGEVESFDGRMLRLFDRGHREEPVFERELRAIGADITTRDPNDGTKQIGFSTMAGHVNGFLDGIATNMPGSTEDTVVVEFKTHSEKSFKDLMKKGVKESKPAHWSQMQLYMGEMDLDEAFYMAVNKNTDELYGEYVLFDGDAYARMMENAHEVIFGVVAPPKISHDPNFYLCRMCSEVESCQRNKEPHKSCRSCEHSRPSTEEDQAIDGFPNSSPNVWVCEFHGIPLDIEAQITGCSHYELSLYLKTELEC